MRQKYPTIIKRFMAKVIYSSDCWLWSAYKNDKGYGVFGMIGFKRVMLAHRFSYQYFIGIIPDGLKVLHSCDIPSCVNPFHLRMGTQQDNVDDMVKRNRDAKAKLNPEQIKFIRDNKHLKTIDLAKMFKVSNGNISQIKNNKSWKNPNHLTY